jgi:hypothetical protein
MTFESINNLIFPPEVAARMQELVRRQADAQLSESERQELDLLSQAKETLDLVRAKAKTLLEAAPSIPVRLNQIIRNGLPVVTVPSGTPSIDPEAVRRCLQEGPF